MRPRLIQQQATALRLDAMLKEIEAIERTAQAAIRVYEAARQANARGEPHSEDLCRQAEAVAAMGRKLCRS